MNRRTFRSTLAVPLAALMVAGFTDAHAVERISVSSAGAQANEQSRYPAISGNGRYVVFTSDASNLVAGDTNGFADIFVRDRVAGTTTRISNKASGAQSDGPSYEANISGDGSRVVFPSRGQLLPNGNYSNCYLLDRTANTLQILDVYPNGQPAITCDSASIDYSGTRIALVSGDALDAADSNSYDVYIRDLVANTMRRVSLAPGNGQGNGASTDARISAAGTHVVFASSATNLVSNDTNGMADIFLATTNNSAPVRRVNVGPSGTQASSDGNTGSISATNANGSLLAFSSGALSLPDSNPLAQETLYLRIPGSDATIALSIPTDGIAHEGWGYEPDFDYSGRYLVFASTDAQFAAAGEAGIYVIDLVRGLIALVSEGGNSGNVHQPRLSADGTGIVWYSLSDSQVPGDTNGAWDVFYAANPVYDDTLFADGFEG